MIRLYVRHHVEDYSRWRKVYDEFDPERKPMGVKADGVYRNVDDASQITVFHDFDSIASAKSFAGSEALRKAMDKAGLTSAPEIWFTEKV